MVSVQASLGSESQVTVKVPAGATQLLGFTSGAVYRDSLGNDVEPQAFVSANLAEQATQVFGGAASSGLIGFSNKPFFPRIPVREGETLLVGSSAECSAILWFLTA
jgi:hypothetical protein